MKAMLMAALLLAPTEVQELLQRGPLVSVETDAQGKFAAAVGLTEIDAPVERVWAVMIDFAKYREFMPRVVGCETRVLPQGPRVEWEIDSPGLNTHYTVQYAVDARAHVAEGKQVHGDLEGSTWKWELFEVAPGRTRVRYTSRARNFSKVLNALEDEAQTITAGLNVGAAITVLRALKKRCEG